MKKYLLLIILLFPIGVFATDKEQIKLYECIDGDTATFIINEKEEKVRFLAINTEESVSRTSFNTFMGKVAGFYTCLRLKIANKIEIEYDSKADKKDKYDRKLGWIFVDGVLLQKDLVAKGLAKTAYLYDDYKYTDELENVEKIAKEANLGIWNNKNYIAQIYNLYQKVRKIFT